MDPRLFRPLFAGPIDIIGDVHGELGALHDLLAALGYDRGGEHPRGRRLVFIGDLCDRGEDSPGVVSFVEDLVSRGLAQCLLGNHELNLLCGSRKEGNGWFFDEDHDQAAGKFTRSRRAAGPQQQERFLAFFDSLPLALERTDLRLVHAAWDEAAITLLRDCQASPLELYRAYQDRARDIARQSGLNEKAAAEWRRHGAQLHDPAATVPLLEHMGRLDTHYQMANPVRIATSGPEALAPRTFYASGKWRMVERLTWWQRYRQMTPVLVGHYWRWPTAALRERFSRGEHDLFEGTGHDEWHGLRRNVYCLDFGVGARYRERAGGRSSTFETRLGAVRWPERELVTDDGARRPLRPGLPEATASG